MADTSSKNSQKPVDPQTETFTVTFKNGALTQLQDAADALGIKPTPESLSEVLQKGLKFIQLAKKNKVKMDTETETLHVELKDL